jgi:hypothetical protein
MAVVSLEKITVDLWLYLQCVQVRHCLFVLHRAFIDQLSNASRLAVDVVALGCLPTQIAVKITIHRSQSLGRTRGRGNSSRRGRWRKTRQTRLTDVIGIFNSTDGAKWLCQ